MEATAAAAVVVVEEGGCGNLGEVLAEGKTKRIHALKGEPQNVVIVSKDSITAGNGEKKDEIPGKAQLANVTTCNVFRLLQLASLPTHFVRQESDSSFKAKKCSMIPLEVIVRRVATGSLLKRLPNVKEGQVLSDLLVEFTYKDDELGDPLISEEEIVAREMCCEGLLVDHKIIAQMKSLAKRAFLLLERAWRELDVVLVDFKVEFGVAAAASQKTPSLLLADVIDNDSWRIWPHGDKSQMKDKQVYRNMPNKGVNQLTQAQIQQVVEVYSWVAKHTARFLDSYLRSKSSEDSTALVGIIMGSQSDWPTMKQAADVLEKLGVPYETKIVSAHRTPDRLYAYAKTAKSRGLKAIIAGAGGAAHLPGMTASLTTLPVFGVPVQSRALRGQDSLLSIVQMPRGIPVGTLAIGESGAVNAAILAASCLASCADYPHIEEALRAFRQAQTEAVAEFPVDETSPSSSSSHAAKESERVFDVSKEQVNKACKQTLGRALPTGSVIGIMGGGQLAKMIITAATQLGYRTHVYCPDPHSPAFQVTDRKTVAPYLDKAALQLFAAEVDVITYEFENIPLETVQFLATMRPVRPEPSVLAVCQNRVKEKSFVNETLVGCSCPETMEATTIFAEVSSVEQLKAQMTRLGLPVVLKTNEGGYDGKGQVIIRQEDEVEAAWGKLARGGSSSPLILEKFVEFQTEVSMIVARSEDGTVSTFPLVENFHQNHILKRSVIPPFSSSASSTNSINKAQLEKTSEAASSIVRRLAEGFQLVGVVCVEMFLMADGKLLVNEMAPRPHNSGHWTIEACETSQFAQLVRAICGLPLGGTRLLLPASSSAEGRVEMINLLGKEVEEAMDLLRDNVNAHVHIYGKNEAKEGRKMGHVTFLY